MDEISLRWPKQAPAPSLERFERSCPNKIADKAAENAFTVAIPANNIASVRTLQNPGCCAILRWLVSFIIALLREIGI